MSDVFTSIPAMFQARIAERAAVALVLHKVAGSWRGVTGRELARDIRRIALGLASLGVSKGDRVGIVSGTRLEWANVDLATLHLGAVTVGVYPTLLAKDVAYQLEHSEARVCVVEDARQLEKLRERRGDLAMLERVIVIDPAGVRLTDRELSLDDLLARGERRESEAFGPAAFERAWRDVAPADLATIIYTSGTTGPPKGAKLTHGNICHTVCAAASLFPKEEEETGIVFLPMAHALQRVATYAGIYRGARGAYATSVETLMDDMREIRPTVQASVPRMWEKIHARIVEGVARASPTRRRLFHWAVDVGRRTAPYRKEGRPLPLALRIPHALAKRLVYDRVKRAMFGDRVRFLTSGGAPIGVEILELFYALGILIIEGYGLTETAAPATINRLDRFELGTVGLPIPGTDVRIADDGEVLVRGPGVFAGYWRDEPATLAAFEEGGWFKTGDIGALDARGFLRITDRKKDLIVTSVGKKIPPSNVESAVKARSPLVASVLVHGDRRKFLTALVALEPDEALGWARARGVAVVGTDFAALARAPEVRAEVGRAVDEANATLAPHERVKRWDVVGERWSVEDGSLTPTLKLKRRALEARYAARLDAFYREDEPAGVGVAPRAGV